MGTITTTQPGTNTASFSGNGNVVLGAAANFAYAGATTTCTWTLQARPGGSAAAITPKGINASLTMDIAGTYTVRFTDSSAVNTDVDLTAAAAIPANIPDYTLSNPTTLRVLDVSAGTATDVKQVLGTLIQDLIDKKVLQ